MDENVKNAQISSNLTPITLKLKVVDPVRVLNGCVKFYQSLIFHCRDKLENVIFRSESLAAKKGVLMQLLRRQLCLNSKFRLLFKYIFIELNTVAIGEVPCTICFLGYV